jgi:chromosome segregation ATPase
MLSNNIIDQLQEDLSKVLTKQPTVISAEQMRSDEVLSFPVMERAIEKIMTDSRVIEDARKDWQEVQKIFSMDPALEVFKQKYETIFNALEESYQNETKQSKKCKEYAAELITVVGTTQTNQRFANDYAETIGILKTEIKNNSGQVVRAKRKEEELRAKMIVVKEEIDEIKRQLEKGIAEIQAESERVIDEHTKTRNELTITSDEIHTRLREVRNKTEYALRELRGQEEVNLKNITEVTNLKEQIAHLQLEINREEARKRNMEAEMEVAKKRIDEAVEERDRKNDQLKENVKRIEGLKSSVLSKAKEKEKLHENVHSKIVQVEALKKEKEKQRTNLGILERHLTEQREEYTNRTTEIAQLEQTLTKSIREHEIYTSKKLGLVKQRKELEQSKGWLEQEVDEELRALEERKKALSGVEDEIDTVFRNKEEINRDIRKGEDEEHIIDGDLAGLHNNLKKLENHIRGYQIEAQKLNRIINLLEKEQEKYGIDASQAHAKYYQTLEELKIKNNLINELQKKNTELDAKLKHQQNLYEAVRSDRNLYSKNLLQAHEEIADLTKKYTRMSHQVDQLKDELKVKDADLVKQDRAVQKIVRENEKNKVEKGRVEKNIANTDSVIKDQTDQVARLKFIISEAYTEKSRQHKDYEMVVNERDILGGQLIKRNQELAQLYEKIKIAQSNLAKGESHYREKQKNFASFQNNLIKLRKEFENTKEQIECVEDLKQEVASLNKELLNQKGKVKALRDEVEIPMNVHRWRKIEAVDQENYERILKIQAIQRRLIAKTEEASEKDNLIKEKEKLYMELKNILARQPGPEIQQELAMYKENLKEKSAQMKKMMGELRQSQSQVSVHKFEIDRIKGELTRLKKEYFKRRNDEDKENRDDNRFANIGQNFTIPMAYRSNFNTGSENADLLVGKLYSNPQQA